MFGGVEGKAAGEDRQPAQHGPLGLGEQPVAPVHRRPQCRLAGYGRARPCGQEVETVGQGLGDPLHAHHAHPGGGQLDGKGDAVQVRTDGRHRRGVVVGYGEVRAHRPGPVGEQAGRLGSVKGRYAQASSSLRHR